MSGPFDPDALFDVDHGFAWGITIVLDLLLLGMSAAALLIVAISVRRPRTMGHLTTPAAMVAAVCATPVPFLLMYHLGQPSRFFNIILYMEPGSVMGWGAPIIMLQLLVSWLTALTAVRSHWTRGRDRKAARRLVLLTDVGILTSALAIIYPGLLLMAVGFRPLWTSPLTLPLFIVTAVSAGCSAIILASRSLGRSGRSGKMRKRSGLAPLADIIYFALAGAFLLAILQLAAMEVYGRSGDDTTWTLTQGPMAPYFIVGELAFGILVPLTILGYARARDGRGQMVTDASLYSIAGLLAIIGAFMDRVVVIIGGQSVPYSLGIEREYMLSVHDLVSFGIASGAVAASAIVLALIGVASRPVLPLGQDPGQSADWDGSGELAEDEPDEERSFRDEAAGNGILGKRISRRTFVKATAAASAGAIFIARKGQIIRKAMAQSGGMDDDGSGGQRYGMVIDLGLCIGCNACVEACKQEYGTPAARWRTWVMEARSGLTVVFVPRLCNHCSEPPCIPVCPVKATYKNKEGLVLQRPDRCIGCGYCISACPYDARFINTSTHVADKCDLCIKRLSKGVEPACVVACPTRARILIDRRNLSGEAKNALAKGTPQGLRQGLGTDPNVLYVAGPEGSKDLLDMTRIGK